MPSPAEVAANVAMMAFVVGAVHYLRARQPDPNPAIEAVAKVVEKTAEVEKETQAG